MKARELIRNPVLSYGQTAFLLGVSSRTLYRWEEQNRMPRSAELVLKSIRSGLPVLAGQIWKGWRFDDAGNLQSPGDYPFRPGDLWALEFLYRNGLFGIAARGELGKLKSLGIAPAWEARRA